MYIYYYLVYNLFGLKVLSSRLSTPSRKKKMAPSRKKHKLLQYQECKKQSLTHEDCYKNVCSLYCSY
jgi:hypothetical protein